MVLSPKELSPFNCHFKVTNKTTIEKRHVRVRSTHHDGNIDTDPGASVVGDVGERPRPLFNVTH